MATFLFLTSNGALDYFIGGQRRMTLDQSPSIYDSYFIFDTEVAGAKWLYSNRDSSLPVQADIMSNLRLQSFGNMNADDSRIFPPTLLQDSYVYLIKINILNGNAYYQYLNNTLIYKYPLDFLNNHKDLIYNNGGSRVYK